MKLLRFVTILAISLSGCVGSARLYPENEIAQSMGVLEVNFTDDGTGAGEVTAILPDGEVLKGEYYTIDTSTSGFGTIYSSVYGTAFTTQHITPGSQPGVVSMFGNRGTMVQCEYFTSRPWFKSRGAGACKSSKGALYRLHF